jgi:hypothetical protein
MSNIGRKIYGYCSGYFGRDSYADKVIEAEGVDWIVARPNGDADADPEFCYFLTEADKNHWIAEWSKNPTE